MAHLTDHVVFRNAALSKQFANKLIPIATLYEAYFDGELDIPGDIFALLRDRHAFVKHTLTPAARQVLRDRTSCPKSRSTPRPGRALVREHYDRGNDFFGWFLGERMVYTSGFFTDPGRRSSRRRTTRWTWSARSCSSSRASACSTSAAAGARWPATPPSTTASDATGVTISKNQAAFGNERIAKSGRRRSRAHPVPATTATFPRRKFDKIVSLEMVEHVGVKNLGRVLRAGARPARGRRPLLLQWTGLRRGLAPGGSDLGPLHDQVHFPGRRREPARAPMLKAMEKAGLEIHSVENVSIHYA